MLKSGVDSGALSHGCAVRRVQSLQYHFEINTSQYQVLFRTAIQYHMVARGEVPIRQCVMPLSENCFKQVVLPPILSVVHVTQFGEFSACRAVLLVVP